MKLLCFLLVAALPVTAAISGRRVQAIANSTSAGRGAQWGIEVADSQTGRLLYAFNAHKLFTPASNVKLLTTALALTKLGPTYRVETRVLMEGHNLVLYGSGDANLSGRRLPYDVHGVSADPLRAIEALATQIAATGLKTVEGDIIGDDTAFDYAPIPDGWEYADAVSDDGAPVSALCINDNVVTLHIRKESVEFEPNLPVFEIVNEIQTGDTAKVTVTREPGSYRLLLTGTLPPGAVYDEQVSVGDPARFAAMALKAALIRHGVNVNGAASARHRYAGEPLPAAPTSAPIASLSSAPLIEDLQVTDKVSQNLHAELLLRQVATQQNGHGSLQLGLAAMKEFLAGFHISPGDYDLRDGSGLARKDLITPDALILLLRGMDASPQAEAWRSLLPVSGTDGSLRDRLGRRATGKVLAKTGSLTHVAALSGYLQTRKGHALTFSIIVNAYNGPAGEMRGLIDKLVLLMMQ
jgi:D-alanyl-D-alanine carboxypeptidase/D-alanyl-D-alanine-endopeptidase (penicillin-binding protein 4)